MKEDFQKFMELVKTEESLQKKLEEAGKNYDGEKTEEAIFHTVLEPVAKEAGFSFTMDEVKQSVQELSLDEMSQVAGGFGVGLGAGGFDCDGPGLGLGTVGGWKAIGGCFVIGIGTGRTICTTVGITDGVDETSNPD